MTALSAVESFVNRALEHIAGEVHGVTAVNQSGL